jgi:uncharacterized membrane protein
MWVSLIFGGLFIWIAPPLSGGDEHHHLRRAYEVATGYWVGNSVGPRGLYEFEEKGMEYVYAGMRDHHYKSEYFTALNAIELQSDTRTVYRFMPSISAQFPLAHVLYFPAIAIGLAFELKPLTILYFCRGCGLLLATFLVTLAIRITPIGKWGMTAVALLPTAVFYRSFVHTDGLMLALAFLFIALILRFVCTSNHDAKNQSKIIVISLLLAPLKIAYYPLIALCLLIKRAQLAKPENYMRFLLGVIFAAAIPIGFWLGVIHQFGLSSTPYETRMSAVINPSLQMDYILRHPLPYMKGLFDYLLSPSTLPMWIVSAFGELGWSQVFLSAPIYALILIYLAVILYTEGRSSEINLSRQQRMLVLGIFLLIPLLILTFVNIAFNPLGSVGFESFQGRYFLPILPLLMLLFSSRPTTSKGIHISLLTMTGSLLWLAVSVVTLYRFYGGWF